MDDAKKQLLKAELTAVKSMVAASTASAGALTQTSFPVAGPVVNIPTLNMAAQAFRLQADAIEKLANLVEKVINAS